MEAILKQQLYLDLKQSMKERDTLKTSTLRMLLSAIRYAEIKADRQVTLTDEDIFLVIAKEIKQREESIEAFQKGNRQDLADKEAAEKVVLQSYMPIQLTWDEIVEEARATIAGIGARGLSDKGKVMSVLMNRLKGRASGKEINSIVTELLNTM